MPGITMNEYHICGGQERLHLGLGVQVNNALFNCLSGDIFIGDHTVLGHNVMVLTGRHEFENGVRKPDGEDIPHDGYAVHIGKGCWIGSGAIISGGVTIGDNTIIGAGSVVVKDIPPGVFACGNPCAFKRDLS